MSINRQRIKFQELQQQMQVIIHQGILKTIENFGLRTKVYQSLENKRVLKLTLIGGQIIIDLKFGEGNTTLKEKFYKTYVKLFAILPLPKDEIINYILFIITYNIHWTIWKDPLYKEKLNPRFVYDCYHIIIFFANGLYVSDGFIKTQIDKIFTSKFLEYERIKEQILQQKKLEQKKKQQQKSFMGKKIEFPVLQGTEGQQFAKNLNEKFKPPKLTRKDSVKIESFDDQQQELPAQTKYLLSHLQLNVNQISPSIKQVLHMEKSQVPFSRAKLLQHNFEKSDERPQLANILKVVPVEEQKIVKKQVFNIFDQFDIRAPQKEYYQKFPKVDPLFKEMLDLNYVLNNHQESMNQLYSTKELGKNQVYVPPKDEPPKKEKKASSLIFDTLVEEQPTIDSVMKTNNEHVSTNGNYSIDNRQLPKVQPIYQGKQKEYKQKYDRLVQSESTDAKINSIQKDLQHKTFLVSSTHHRKR
ncbi:hypothetical protein pb186bvf_015414 [Paramecium bursaria]